MELTYPTKREVGQIIDSQVPAGKGYASFQESNNLGCGWTNPCENYAR